MPPVGTKSFQAGSLQNAPFLNTTKKLNQFQLPIPTFPVYNSIKQPTFNPVNQTVSKLFNNQPFSTKPNLGLPDFSNLTTNTNMLSTSMAEAVRQLNQQTQGNDATTNFNQSLQELVKPIPQTSQDIFNLGDSSNKATTPIGNLIPAANGLIGGLNSVSSKMYAWQPPTPQISTFRVGIDSSGNVVTTGKTAVTGNARGGVVESDGLAYLHAGNIIVPARVSRTFGTSNALNIFRQNPKNSATNFQNLLSSLITSKPQDNFGIKSFTNFKESANQSQFRENNLSKESIGGFSSISSILNSGREKDISRTERFNDVRQFAREKEFTKSNSQQPNVNLNITVNIPTSAKAEVTERGIARELGNLKPEIERMLSDIFRKGSERH